MRGIGPARLVSRTRGQNQEHLLVFDRINQTADEFVGRRIGPVHVLDDANEGRHGCAIDDVINQNTQGTLAAAGWTFQIDLGKSVVAFNAQKFRKKPKFHLFTTTEHLKVLRQKVTPRLRQHRTRKPQHSFES